MINYKKLMPELLEISTMAGLAILEIYQHPESMEIQTKSDSSPVTCADLMAHEVIKKGLNNLTPHWPILSEEDADIPYEQRQGWERYWLVDPLDGTKEFIKGNDEFTVNIALIEKGHSVLGIVHMPCFKHSYFAWQGGGAYKQQGEDAPIAICSRHDPSNPLFVVTSRHHGHSRLQTLLSSLGDPKVITYGSALKFCAVAEGEADLYPRLGPTSEWDTAAAQCIVEQAGGLVCDEQGDPFRYNQKPNLLNPAFFACGTREQKWLDFFSKLMRGDE